MAYRGDPSARWRQSHLSSGPGQHIEGSVPPLETARGLGESNSSVRPIGTEKSYAVEVDQVGHVVRTPDVGFPGDVLKVPTQHLA